MLEIADIFHLYGDEYLQKFGNTMLPSQRRAFMDILACRTPVMGGHVYSCDRCNHQVYSYHSCRNRSCPKCHGNDMERWLEERQKELLPVEYFHLVFTIPQELHQVAKFHQKELYAILMKAAAEALAKLAADPHYIGGIVGILAVLHTWTRTLLYHPHVHCLVPAGGVSADGEWLPARKNYLVPVRALSKIFRAVFKDMLTQKLLELQVPATTWHKDWVVYAKPVIQGPDQVLQYLGRYVHRIALTNSRILAIDNGQVTFRYQKSGDTQWKTMTLSAMEFIRRFLQHVLPRGVHKVRYYGLWSPTNRKLLGQLQLRLNRDRSNHQPGRRQKEKPDSHIGGISSISTSECQKYPHCGEGILRRTGTIPRGSRSPP